MFDNNWVCTRCNLAANYSHSTRHNRYWYAFERATGDGKFDKWIRVEAHDATKIYNGTLTVEQVCNKLEAKQQHFVNYQFKTRR